MLKKISKKGAASFYIVAFSTLMLVVIATSYAMMVMSEITRTMNDDLSQSAYDSALAGIEDAEIAFANYQRCLEAGVEASEFEPQLTAGDGISCSDIVWYMKKENQSCDMVGKMLYGKEGEVELGGVETSSGTTTNQAYTCVKIITDVSDYRSSLGGTAGKYVETIKAGVAEGGTNTVSALKFSWYSGAGTKDLKTETQYSNVNGDKPVFPTSKFISVPPTIELQIVQTMDTYNLTDFDKVEEGQTNRATLYLVPSDGNGVETIEAGDVVKTNNRYATNGASVVKCNENNEFYCTVDIKLPKAIGANETAYRANDTFLISVSIPYGEPDTDFSLELICDDDTDCGGEAGSQISESLKTIKLSKAQVAIESTGRANDLVRRVEARLGPADEQFGIGTQSPYYALMVKDGVTKNMTVKYEKSFKF